MKVRIQGPQSLQGNIEAPRSKAYTHRALLAALLTHGKTRLEKPLVSDDTKRTLDAVQTLGGRVQSERNNLLVEGPEELLVSTTPIDCGESGATLRFLTAVASISPTETRLTAEPRLAERPISPLLTALRELGAKAQAHQTEAGLEISIKGPLMGGETSLPGDVSSQFVSGLLLAAPLAKSDVIIEIEGRLESRPYVNMTLQVQRRHGITIEASENMFRVPAFQEYRPTSHEVPGDFSSISFLLAATGIAGQEISVTGLGDYEAEPDSTLLDFLPTIGLKLEKNGDSIAVGRGRVEPFDFEASDHPDAVPALETLACAAHGVSEITGLKRLQYKESNRLETIPRELGKLGARISVIEDRVRIEGGYGLVGANLSSHDDHRVAMACSVAGLTAKGETIIDDAEVVSKSYPDFYSHLAQLGAKLVVE